MVQEKGDDEENHLTFKVRRRRLTSRLATYSKTSTSCGGGNFGNKKEGTKVWGEEETGRGMRGKGRKRASCGIWLRGFYIVTRVGVMRHLSVTEICDWLIVSSGPRSPRGISLRYRSFSWNFFSNASLSFISPSKPGRENICKIFDQLHGTGELQLEVFLEHRFRIPNPPLFILLPGITL